MAFGAFGAVCGASGFTHWNQKPPAPSPHVEPMSTQALWWAVGLVTSALDETLRGSRLGGREEQ